MNSLRSKAGTSLAFERAGTGPALIQVMWQDFEAVARTAYDRVLRRERSRVA